MKPSELIIRPDGSIYHLALRPEELCDTIITVGDAQRVARVSKYFDQVHFTREHREIISHRGRLGTKELMVLSTGMGTDNIEIVLNELDALVNVDFNSRSIKEEHTSLNIIRAGTSGSISRDIQVGSVLASETGMGMDNLLYFYQREASAEELEIALAFKEYMQFPFDPYLASADSGLLDKFGAGCIYGNTLTCPGFYLPQGRAVRNSGKNETYLDKLLSFDYKDFSLSNMEMETAAYYALGKSFGHKTVSLNAILANRISGKFASDPEALERNLIMHILDRIGEI